MKNTSYKFWILQDIRKLLKVSQLFSVFDLNNWIPTKKIDKSTTLKVYELKLSASSMESSFPC